MAKTGMLAMLMGGPKKADPEKGPPGEALESAQDETMAHRRHLAMNDFIDAVHKRDHRAAHMHMQDWMDMGEGEESADEK